MSKQHHPPPRGQSVSQTNLRLARSGQHMADRVRERGDDEVADMLLSLSDELSSEARCSLQRDQNDRSREANVRDALTQVRSLVDAVLGPLGYGLPNEQRDRFRKALDIVEERLEGNARIIDKSKPGFRLRGEPPVPDSDEGMFDRVRDRKR